MVTEETWKQSKHLTIHLTPHEAKQLWASIDAGKNSVAQSVDAACCKFFKASGIQS